MPDPVVAIALLVLVALVEWSPAVRLPTGLLLAIGLLASSSELLPVAALGAVGVAAARVGMALAARRGRDRARPASPGVAAQRDALRTHLARSPAYARTTFTIAALPGVPSTFVFPLLGAMRAPLWPAIAGTMFGRLPVLALTAAAFAWLGRLVSENDTQAAITLAMFAIILLVVRTVARVDWEHRAATGEWRLSDPDEPLVRMTTRLGTQPAAWPRGASDSPGDEGEVLEGELVGEDEVDDDGDDDDPPAALPPTGAAPS